MRFFYDAGYVTVNAEAKNKDTEVHTFTYIVSFNDANNKLLGVWNGTLLAVDPGETMPFQFITEGKYKTVVNVNIQVEKII